MRNNLRRLLSLFLVFSLLFPTLSFGAEEIQPCAQYIRIEVENEKTDLMLGEKPKLKVLDADGKAYNFDEIDWTVDDESIARIDPVKGKKNIDKAKLITLSKGNVKVTATLKESPETKAEVNFSIEDNIKTVYMRIEGYDHTILPRTAVEVPLEDISEYLNKGTGSSAGEPGDWGIDRFNNPTNAHAIVNALVSNGFTKHQEGQEDMPNTFDLQDYGQSLYIAMIDGDREKGHKGMSGWMYRVNDEMPGVGCQELELENEDEIIWYYGVFGFDNAYTKMKVNKKTIKIGEEVELEATGDSGGFEQKIKPLKDAIVLINGKEYIENGEVIKTDANGKAILTFEESGEYEISLVRYKWNENLGEENIDIVRPEPIYISVNKDTNPEEPKPIEVLKPIISINPTEETKEVTVTISSEQGTKIEYKIGDTNQWIDYNGPFKVWENSLVYAKAIDEKGNESEIAKYEINNIVKEKDPVEISLRERIEKILPDIVDYALEYKYSMDWVVVGLARTGNRDKIPTNYLPAVTKEIKELVEKENRGEYVQTTDYERRVLGILAAGGDPRNVDGIDVIERIYNSKYIDEQGINAKIFGLIALDSGKYKVPDDAKWDREKLIEDMLKLECSNIENFYGKKAGWTFGDGTNADVDMTGMALTALAPYYNQRNDVKAAIDRAVEWLSTVQRQDGGFESWGSANSESCAQAIMGLCANNIDPTEERFTKSGGNVVEALLGFFNENADEPGFAHIKENGFKPNGMANEQALYSLAQYLYYLDGKGSIYQWGDKDCEPLVERKFGEEVNITSNRIKFEGGIVLDLTDVQYDSSSTVTVFDVTDSMKPTKNSVFDLYGKIVEIKFTNVDARYGISIDMPKSRYNSAIYIYNERTRNFEYLHTSNKNDKLVAYISPRDIGESIIFGVLGETNGPEHVSFDYEVKKNKVHFYNLYAIDESDIQYFEIYKDGKRYAEVRSDEYLTSPLEWNKEYRFKIRAVDNLGNVSYFTEEIKIRTEKNPNSTGNINVSIRVEGYDHNVISMQSVNVDIFDLDPYLGKGTGSSATESNGWGKEKFEHPTAAHATVKVLNEHGISYDLQDYGWSLYMSMIDGDREFNHRRTSGWMYRVNGWLPNYGCQEYILKDGDVIEWYFGAYGFETWYTKISANKAKIKTGEEVEITLEGEITDLSGKGGRGQVSTKGVNNAEIYVDGKQFYLGGSEVKTDKSGKAKIKFDKPGRYSISAERINGQGLHDIVRPVPIVIEVDGKSLEGNGIINNPLYLEEYDIVIDKKSTETDIVNAVRSVEDKLEEQKGKSKKSKEEIDMLSDTTDVLTIIDIALDKVKKTKAIEAIGDSYKKVLEIFTEQTGILTTKKDKENAGTIATKDVLKVAEKLIDIMENTDKISEMTNYTIDSLGKVVKNIGKENSKEIEQRIIKLVQKTIDKTSTVNISKENIKTEKNKIFVRIEDKDIEKGKQIDKNKRTIEEKLNKNNIKTAKDIVSKLKIDVPVLNKQEIELIIPRSSMSRAKQYKIKNIQIQTENGDIGITADNFKTTGNEFRVNIKKNSNSIELKALDEKGAALELNNLMKLSIPFKGKVNNTKNVTAVLIKEDGTKENIGGRYDSTTESVKFVTNKLGKFTVEEVNKHFEDLKGHEWAKESIESMAAKGIINGKTDTIFDPSANITRAEFAALASRMLKYNEDTGRQLPFKDVKKNKWYYSSIVAVYENGLIEGKSQTSFDPEGNITREEVVKIIGKILESNSYKKQEKSKINVFKDSKNISLWAQESVAMALQNGVIKIEYGNNFNPKTSATRAEVAVMLYRLYDLIMPN